MQGPFRLRPNMTKGPGDEFVWRVEKSFVNNLFRGIYFSHEDKIHEHIQKSLLLGRRTKGNLAWCFHSILQVFERGYLQKISYLDRNK